VVLAGALVGTISSFIPNLLKNKKSIFIPEIPKAIYCGTFVGMTTSTIANGYQFIILSSIIAGVLYWLSKNTFVGFGGKLGTVAFGGVTFAFLLIFIIS